VTIIGYTMHQPPPKDERNGSDSDTGLQQQQQQQQQHRHHQSYDGAHFLRALQEQRTLHLID